MQDRLEVLHMEDIVPMTPVFLSQQADQPRQPGLESCRPCLPHTIRLDEAAKNICWQQLCLDEISKS